MIYKTWFCLNRNCRHEFTVADVENPPCPRCTGTRVQWIPRTTGVISSRTRNIDNTVKELRQAYGDKNYRSPVAGEAVNPKPNIVPVPGRTRRFAPAGGPGWGVDLPMTPNHQLYDAAYCGPTGVTAKVSAQVGNAPSKVPLDPRAATSTGAIPRFEARHQGAIRR